MVERDLPKVDVEGSRPFSRSKNKEDATRRLFCFLESGGFQFQSGGLVDAEHDVHVLHSLSDGSLEQVVNADGDEQFVAVLVAVDEGLVGVDDLLQVDGLVGVVGEGRLGIERLVRRHDVVDAGVGFHHLGGEDAAGEVAAVGDEVYLGIEVSLHLP